MPAACTVVWTEGGRFYGSGYITLWTYVTSVNWSNAVLWSNPLPAVCYANCDLSTSSPLLNVADFTCFLQKFAAADPYANCDNSTTTPVLNVSDFTCFLQKFAAGCM
jgi:hypothetical protein